METQQTPVKTAYSPKQYGFLGFFLSLVPVFFMSFSNAKIFPNGKEIKKGLMKFAIAFGVIVVAAYAARVWAFVYAAKGLAQSIMENPGNLNAFIAGSRDQINIPQVKFAQLILYYFGYFLLILNTVLLTFIVRFTNKHELPMYNKLHESKQIQMANMALPVAIGVAVIMLEYNFGNIVVSGIARLLLS